MPNPEDEPDEFWNGEKFLTYLEEKTVGKDASNAANWYAHYQLGISYLIAGRKEEAWFTEELLPRKKPLFS